MSFHWLKNCRGLKFSSHGPILVRQKSRKKLKWSQLKIPPTKQLLNAWLLWSHHWWNKNKEEKRKTYLSSMILYYIKLTLKLYCNLPPKKPSPIDPALSDNDKYFLLWSRQQKQNKQTFNEKKLKTKHKQKKVLLYQYHFQDHH